MGQLSSVIKGLGVAQVIWIDDMFAPFQQAQPDYIDLASKIAERADALAGLQLAEALDPEDLVADLASRLQESPQLAAAAHALVSSTVSLELANSLMNLMGCKAEPKTGSDWKVAVHDKTQHHVNTLFLIDRDFSGENILGDDSDALLKATIVRLTPPFQVSLRACAAPRS